MPNHPFMRMQRNTLDLSALQVDSTVLQRIYLERLAYADVYREKGKEVPRMNESAERYARVVWHFESKGVAHSLDDAARAIRELFDQRVVDVTAVSQWGRDNSWIHWDLAKQLYYFLGMPRDRIKSRYRVSNADVSDPTTDIDIRDEIVHRHIGWEVEASGTTERWRHIAGVSDILDKRENRSSVYDNRLSSAALAALGQALCAQGRLNRRGA